MGVRVSNLSNWCMGRIKEKKRVAAASRGQVHLNPLGIDAAIKAYRTAVLDSGRFVGMKKLMMLMSVPLCFVGRTRINVPLGSGRRLAIAHPVLMSCQLINEKIVRQWSVWLTFMQIIFPLPFSDSGKSGRMD